MQIQMVYHTFVKIDKFTSNNKENSISFDSLGSLNFMSLMKHVDLMIGNSSSGIIEAPHFNLYTINIGDRQNGRVKASSIIDCSGTKASIFKAISKGYKIKSEIAYGWKETYSSDTITSNILDILENVSLKNILYKEFKDYN